MSSVGTDLAGRVSPHRVVRASAGTGKTHRLTNRYLALLGIGADPGTLVATTFTRKAAGEVRARVLRRLADARLDRGGERRQIEAEIGELTGERGSVDAAWCDAVLGRVVGTLDRLSIGTIDAWLARMSGVLAWEMSGGGAWRTIAGDSEEAARYRLAAVERLIERSGRGDDAFATLIDRLRAVHGDAARRSVTESLVDLLGGLEAVVREAPDEAAWSVLGPVERVDPAAIDACLQRLLGLEDRLPTTKGGMPDRRWRKAVDGLVEHVRAGRWSSAAGGGLIKAMIAAGPDEPAAFYGTPIEGEVLAACASTLKLVRRGLLRPIARQARALGALGSAYVAELDAAMAESGVMRYEDVTDRLARRLPTMSDAEGADLFYRLDASIEHLLIDEFQDTSLDQWRVVRETAEEVMSDATTGRTFFAVGDAKQAIYGWRGGRVELFDRVQGLVERYHGRVESMDTSYRSAAVVIDAVNRVFGSLAGRGGAAAEWGDAARRFAATFVEHAPSPSVIDQRLTGSFVVETSGGADVESDPADEPSEGDDAVGASAWRPAHCRHVARRVGEMLARRPERRVAVLCRRRQAMASVLHALREDPGVAASGVSVSLQGGRRLADEPAVQAVLSALRLAEREDDAAAAFHVASGPIGAAVGLASVEAARSAEGRASAARRVRRELIERGPVAAVARWSSEAAGACDAGAAGALDRLAAWLDGQADTLDPLAPGRIVEAVETAVVESGVPAGVVVMTIHASKGLEFDSVVLPDLDRKPLSPDRWLELRVDDDPCGPIEAVFPWIKADQRWLDDRFGRAYRAWEQRQRYEELCALYVAMTRARHDLRIVLEPVKTDDRGELDKRHRAELSKTLGQVVFDAVAPGGERPTQAEAVFLQSDEPVTPESEASSGAMRRGEGAIDAVPWRLAVGPSRGVVGVSPSRVDDGDEPTTGDGTLGRLLSGGTGRRTGSVVHALLERVAWIDLPGGEPDAQELAAAAGRAGVEQGAVDACVDRVISILMDPTVRGWLSAEGPGGDRWSGLWRERRFAIASSSGEPMVSGVVDRVMVARDASGRATHACVVDYKTDRRAPGAADAAFAAALRDRHAAQLRAYRRAVAELLGIDPFAVRSALIATDGPLVVAID